MTQPGERPKGFTSFRRSRPQPTPLFSGELVRFEPMSEGGRLPLTARPNLDGVDVAEWAQGNREAIETRLLEHGALLFRGFDLRTADDFERFASSICPELFGEYGDLPQEKERKGIYHSTPYPADKAILFHNESSHLPRWPMKQWFFCVQAARHKGETPIVDCRDIYRRLDPQVIARFQDKGLLYVRNFTGDVDLRWQDFFKTEDRSVVEAACRRSGTDFEWRQDGGLTTRQRCPAVVRHPVTGESSFFNQIQLHHIACLEPEVRESLLALYGEEGLPRNVYYGDGSPIDDSLVLEITDLYWSSCVEFAWQEGDVLMVDNMLVAHARRPFDGPRKILVAMGELIERDQVQT